MKLLVADSDTDQIEMEVGWLRSRGFDVKYALNADRIRLAWIDHRPDLAIVEPHVGGVDVLGLCRDMRSNVHDALVLAVSSEPDTNAHIRCLESGADAYLVKPFLPAMLLAQIHALSRRVRNTLLRTPSSVVTAGPIRVDSLRNEMSVHGRLERLTPTESKLIHLLAINANDVCTLDQIVTHVWGYRDGSDKMLVKAHIRHLREKIEANPSTPRHIVTIPGSGYMLVPYVDQQAVDTASSSGPRASHKTVLRVPSQVMSDPSDCLETAIAGRGNEPSFAAEPQA